MRPGIKFQNGEQFDAEAVKCTLERRSPPTAASTAAIGAIDHTRNDSPTRRARVRAQSEGEQTNHYLWTPRNIVGLSGRVTGFTLPADGVLRLQDVRPKQ
jgi:ABC-type transport system substrate-binding protein